MTRTSTKVVVALVFAAAYAAVGLVRHAHFGSNAYDLGVLDQMVWHLSRFEWPVSTMNGVWNTLRDHASVVDVLFVPVSWLWPSANALIITQALALGLSIVPVWMGLERKLPPLAAALMITAYGFFWGLQGAAQFDVHTLTFAPGLIALMLLSLDRLRDPALDDRAQDRARLMLLGSAAALCLVSEDQMPLVAATMALWAWLTPHARDRKLALVLTGVALIGFGLMIQLVVPALTNTPAGTLGAGFRQTVAHPVHAFLDMMSPFQKWFTLLWWLLPFLFLPLLSVYGCLLLPLVLERFLSSDPRQWGTELHYTAPFAPILVFAAADALRRLTGLRARATEIAAVCAVVSVFALADQPLPRLVTPSFYRAPAFAATASRALALVPPDARVAAQSPLVPHLSRRREIYMLRGAGPVDDVDVVVAAMGDVSSWPFSTPFDVRARIAHYESLGFSRVFDEHGWVVLKRGGAR